LSLKPSIAYLVLNFCALWKKQTTLPSLAYAGIPYQVVGESAGALALMTAWSRSPRARSGSGISAIFSRTALSPSAWPARGPRRGAVFSSWARSFIAPRSSSVNPSYDLFFAVVLLADFCASFIAGFLP
jgi:alpha-beta hydrolase superfamily lysophospholipase